MGWTGVVMRLNSRGEQLRLTDFKLLVRCMPSVTERTCLNWLFGVSFIILTLSYCAWGRLRQYLWEGNWDVFFDVNLVSQGAGCFKC